MRAFVAKKSDPNHPRLDTILIASDTQSHQLIQPQMRIKLLIFIALTASVEGAPLSNNPEKIPEIDFSDHHFSPQTLVVPAGRPLQIKVVNSSREKIEFESFSLNREKIIEPGASITVRLPALRAGRYDFFDDFHNDAPEGVIVAEAASANIQHSTFNIQRSTPSNQ
jgi:hypothetical protein